MKYFIKSLLFFATLFLFNGSFGQNVNLTDSLLFSQDFFDNDENLRLQLKFDISEFRSKKNPKKDYPAELTYFIDDSTRVIKNVEVEMRGVSRQRMCDFPPFFLKLKKSGIDLQHLGGAKKVKVVTLCKNVTGYEAYLLKEYLIYKIYNLITPYSFRVRLVNFKLIDEGRRNRSFDRIFFLIEPEDLLAQRLDCLPIEKDILNYRHTQVDATDIMNMFQYMIGNTDFTIQGRHNIKLLKPIDHTQSLLIPIAYDFDFSGFINTEYADPADILQIKDVRERYYLGMCRSDEQYKKTIDLFNDKKEMIYDLINSFEYLSKKERRRTIKYIEEFYNLMNGDDFIKKELRRTCRN